jgi:hypothetical protein
LNTVIKRDDKGSGDPSRNLHIYYLCISIVLFVGCLYALYLVYYLLTHPDIIENYFPLNLFGLVFLFIIGASGIIFTSLCIHGEIVELLTLERLR